jgi:3-polyprenyl-4-hydroxybenzoate decarboxylase
MKCEPVTCPARAPLKEITQKCPEGHYDEVNPSICRVPCLNSFEKDTSRYYTYLYVVLVLVGV